MSRTAEAASVATAIEAWEQAEAAIGKLGPRRENELLAEADRLVAALVAEDAGRAELLRVLDATDRDRLREWLRSRVLPDVELGLEDPDRFRAHPLVGFSAAEMPIQASLALPEVAGSIKDRGLFEDEEYPGELSWLAGVPAIGDDDRWPESSDGLPLAHVAQLDLVTASERLGPVSPALGDLGLPPHGVLQLFHDLRTLGTDPGDEVDGWLVRWVEQPVRLAKKPKRSGEAYRKAALTDPAAVISIPSSAAAPLSGKAWERYQLIATHIEDHLHSPVLLADPDAEELPSAWESAHHSVAPTSRVGGFGWHGWTDELAEVLAAARPPSESDGYVLLFDVAGLGRLDGWFGDAGHLQAWIRRSDLAARRFDQAWCVLRMD